MQTQLPSFSPALCTFQYSSSPFFQNNLQTPMISIIPQIPSLLPSPTIFMNPQHQTFLVSPSQMNLMIINQQQQQQQSLQYNMENLWNLQQPTSSQQILQFGQQNFNDIRTISQSISNELLQSSTNSLPSQNMLLHQSSQSSFLNLDAQSNNLNDQSKEGKINSSLQLATIKEIIINENSQSKGDYTMNQNDQNNISERKNSESMFKFSQVPQSQQILISQKAEFEMSTSVCQKKNQKNLLRSQSSSQVSKEVSNDSHSDSEYNRHNQFATKHEQDQTKGNSRSEDDQVPIRNNEDPYQTYKYPSQIQNQLRKQVLKRFFKSVPSYLDSCEKTISNQFSQLDKAALKALCRYWSQFDNPTRRLQLKNEDYIKICNQLQVNPEIKPLGQKCLKEIFGKENQFCNGLKYLFQEFNKDANSFAHRKKNLGMQLKWVQASNRISRDIIKG